MNTRHRKSFKQALLGLCLAAGALSTAHAAYVVINADPAFGAPFPSLGWKAVGAIYVPDTCLSTLPNAANSVVFIPLMGGPCAGIQMQDVKLGFYNLANPGVIVEQLNVGTYIADITAPPDGPNDLTQKMLDIEFDAAKNVVGFSTSLSLTVQAFSGIAGGGDNHFSLEFSSAGARLVAFNAPNVLFGANIGQSLAPFNTIAATYTSDNDYVPPTFTTTPAQGVPEPGTLALAGLALAGLGLRARRRAG